MSKISLLLDTRYRTNGKCSLKVSIFHNGSTSYHSLGIYLLPEHWSKPSSESDGFVKKHCADYKRFNFHIQSIMAKFGECLLELERKQAMCSFRTARDLKNYLVKAIKGNESTTFLRFFKETIEHKDNPGTRRLFEETYSKLLSFTGGDDLLFEQVTPKWLDDFTDFMNGSVNYKSIHLRNIRTVYNLAIKHDIAKYEHYPFRKFKIDKEKTAKRALTIDQLCDIRNMPLLDYQEKYRDLFLLSFYLIGINLKDLLHLTPQNIQGDRLIYKRYKTGRIYSLKLEKEALSLISKMRGNKYLLYFLDNSTYESMISRINKSLKELGETKILNKKGKKEKPTEYKFLSTYYARHTWATIAAYLEVPKETIAAALGHGGNAVTDIYIDFDQSKIDVANRKVIDYLISESTKRKKEK